MTELDAILRTIREVEESLERRYARAEGTSLFIWGLVGASIFAFYQLVATNPAPYVAALGPALNWVWLLPMAVGYAATMLVGARLGRLGAKPEQRASLRRGLMPGTITALAVTILLATGRYPLVPGVVLLVSGVSFLAFSWPAPRSASRTTGLGAGLALTLVGALLLVVASAWTSGIAAALFLLAFGALGLVRYAQGR